MLKVSEKQQPVVMFFDPKELEKNEVFFKYSMNIGRAAFINISIFIAFAFACSMVTVFLSRFGIFKWLAAIPWVILGLISIADVYNFSRENKRKEFMEDIVFVEDNGTFWSLFFIEPENTPIPAYLKARDREPDSDKTYMMRINCEDFVLETLKNAQKRKVTLGILNNKDYTYCFNRRAGILRLDDLQFAQEDDYSWYFTYRDKDKIVKSIRWIKGYSGLKEKLEEVGTVAVHNVPFPWLNRPREEINAE